MRGAPQNCSDISSQEKEESILSTSNIVHNADHNEIKLEIIEATL